MKITYIFRTPSNERSIERVFSSIIEAVKEKRHEVHESYSKSFSFWPFGLIYNIIYYAFLSRKEGVYHITGDIQYVACLMDKKKTVLTIHDLVPLHNKKVPRYSKWLCYWLWYYIPLRHLNYITCISESTRKDLLSFFPWAEKKITVIPDPISDGFDYSPKVFNPICPRILHVGTRENKNLGRVIQALNNIHCELVIIGQLTNELRDLLSVNRIKYINLLHITDEEIINEYKKADIISFPSLFEGFGMPIIEGQAIGRPVVTSIWEPMKSVSGGNAILVDPTSVDSIRNGFLTVISYKDKRELCVRGGLDNAKKYTNDIIANNYLKLYSE